MATTETPAIIVETISIAAPVADVFAALTDVDQLPIWWGSAGGYHVTKMESDLRPGGEWIATGLGRDGTPFSVGGVYRVVDAPRLLEMTWRHDWRIGDDPLHDTLVRYELSERDGVTELRLTHSGFVDHKDREDHAGGWPVVLGWLHAYLTR